MQLLGMLICYGRILESPDSESFTTFNEANKVKV